MFIINEIHRDFEAPKRGGSFLDTVYKNIKYRTIQHGTKIKQSTLELDICIKQVHLKIDLNC